MSRRHGALQSSLATATFLGQLVQPCLDLGMNIDAAAQFEGANVLWDQGEMSASIRMLKDLTRGVDLKSQDVHVGRPEILAKLVRKNPRTALPDPADAFRATAFRKLEWRSQM